MAAQSAISAGMAEQHAVELHGQRQLTESARVFLPDLGRGDRRRASHQVVIRGYRPAGGIGNLALAVALVSNGRERSGRPGARALPGQRAWNGVTSDDHHVRIRRPWIGEHGVECIDVAVAVIERQDAH